MSEILQFVFDYQNLFARRLLQRLNASEHLRLQALEELMGENSAAGAGTRRRHARVELGSVAEMRFDNRLLSIVVSNVSAGGMGIMPATDLQVGDLAVIKITDYEGSRRYNLPARVTWKNQDKAGLAFVGAPVEIRTGRARAA